MTTSLDPARPCPRWRHRLAALVAVVAVVPSVTGVVAGSPATASGPQFGGWDTARKIDLVGGNHEDLTTGALDGCPIQAPDGLTLYMASNRPGGHGGLDIWVATRQHRSEPWGAPENLPEPVNSAFDDFCPTPIEGGGLFFVSRRTISGVTCGMGDIYLTRRNPGQGWDDPEHLACAPEGPNSAIDEQGPSYAQAQLYFSRSVATGSGELFVSVKTGDGFGPATPIAALNDASANDIQPNVRKDGRELVFSSNRAGGAGGQDIWSATRASIDQPWSTAVNLGAGVNTAFGESRPSLSNDAAQLLFGRAGPVGTGEGGTGAADVYVTTRQRNP